MKAREIAGVAMLVAFFAVIFALVAHKIGVPHAALVFAAAAFLVAWLVAAISLVVR